MISKNFILTQAFTPNGDVGTDQVREQIKLDERRKSARMFPGVDFTSLIDDRLVDKGRVEGGVGVEEMKFFALKKRLHWCLL